MSKTIWTKERIELLQAYLSNSELSYSQIAKKMGTTSDAVEHAKRRYGLKNIKSVNNTTEFGQKQYEEHYTQMINYLQENLGNVQVPKIKNKSKKKKGDTLNIHITDWHGGRLVKNEQGQIIYDVNVFKSMTNKLLHELLNLLDRYITKGTPITDVNILATGDLCDGMGIFASQSTLSEFAPPFQVMIVAEAIQKIVLALLKRKLAVNFYGVKGNHGEIRVNGKNPDPNANWDLMLYLMLDFWARHLIKSNKLKIYYSELDYLNFVNRGWKYHLRHIAPNQSETSAGKAKFLGWARQHKFDVLVYGHLHHWGAWDRSKITIIRGGALTAGDEFAETLAEESEPIQLIWGCNEKRPVTFLYPLDLGKKERK